ncbi:hypothetical protein ElyMa_001807600 [Elysia marginata]|uniref:MATH domain-containing protein n=1 Tax=Elysia marginata TaxID=1093978 RepID=A0AAV4EH48_9GAST|nr:hypothetical protein ElyMa_001807600 [Elysia marginata]
MEYTRNVISNEMKKKVDHLSQSIAYQADTVQNKFSEFDDRLTRTLEDVNEGLNNRKVETKEAIRALYSGLEAKLNTLSASVYEELARELETSRCRYHAEVEEVRGRLEANARDTLEVIAGRLDKTKFELFSMMEKESQLVRDVINEPPTKGDSEYNQRNYTFDFYVDNFVQRMNAAVNRGDNERPKVRNGIIPTLDTHVHSFSWYIPYPVDTSFQGFAKFTDDNFIKVYLLFGRNPNELGLVARIGRNMACSAIITDLSGEYDDIELNTVGTAENQQGQGAKNPSGGRAFVQRSPWNENEIKTNEKMGLFLGAVCCDDVLKRKLHTPYADGSILLRYNICVS